MGMFDFKGQFPANAMIEAAISKRKGEEEARQLLARQIAEEKQRRQEQFNETLKNAATAATGLNKYQMNKQMAQTLAGSPAVQGYLGNPQVANTGMGAVTRGQTADGSTGVPVPNGRMMGQKQILPFVEAGKGEELLKNAQDFDYKRSTVEDVIPQKDAAGNILGYQRVARQRGARTVAPTGPQQPRGGGSGKSPADQRRDQLLKYRDQFRKEVDSAIPGPEQDAARERLKGVADALDKEFGLRYPEDQEPSGQYATPDEVKAAMRAGKINRDQAKQILQSQFGMK